MRNSLWLVPALYVVAALWLGDWAPGVDRASDEPELFEMSPASARETLAAVATGMIAFTGFVFSVMLLVLQFGSTQFSPRIVRTFRRDPVVKHALGAFIATFVYALYVLTDVGTHDESYVPELTVVLSLLLVLVSVALFLALIHRVTEGLRIAGVLSRVVRDARRALRATYPDAHGARRPAAMPELPEGAEPQVVACRRRPGVVLALDRRRLVRLGRRAGGWVEVVPAVGDHVPVGAPLARVHGAPLPERAVRAAIVVGEERTIEDDAAFALRLLVEIGVRGLATANDSTTAIQALDGLEDLLRELAARDLAPGELSDGDGVVRATVPVPSWDDLVVLSVDELRVRGRDDLPVQRRLRALVLDLLEVVPVDRRAALDAALARLDATAASAFPDEHDRALALAADRQGLGFSR